MAVSIVGILVALFLFLFLVYKGWSVLYVAPLCVLIVAVTGGINPLEALTQHFVPGVVEMVGMLFWVIFLGAIMGKLYADTGAAASLTQTLMNKFVLNVEGDKRIKRAMIVIVVVTAILTFGGIDAFILCFLMFPLCRSIAKQLNIPRRLVPAMLCTSAVLMGSPLAPQFNNILATQILHLRPSAGLIPGLIAALIGEIGIYFVLSRTVLKAIKNGETYDDGPLPPLEGTGGKKLPNFWVCLIPLILVIVIYNGSFGIPVVAKYNAGIIIALAAGILSTMILLGKYISRESLIPGQGKLGYYRSFIRSLNAGADNYPNPIFAVCTPAGLAKVITATAAFGVIVGALPGLPVHPLLLTFIFALIIVTLTSSPPVTLAVIIPILGGMFGIFAAAEGGPPPVVTAGAIARVAALTTTTFETLPFNGLITLACVILSRVSVKEGYAPIFGQTVVCTTIATIIALVLFMLFPGLGNIG
ncbi:MAG: hypothetical protein LBQ88_07595 [Treponema sp.]|jgi:H+/gluconate symporter-like permease|nr:hypothetical protein [Treponema sp.]